MKTLFKKSLFVLMLTFIAVLTLGVSSKVRAAEVVESVDFTTKTAKHSAYTDTWKYDGWTVSGGANNTGGWAYVKMGGKSSNLSKYNKIYIASPAVSSATSKVEVNIIAGSVAKSGMSATVKLEVYSDSSLATLVDSTAAVTVTKSAALLEFEPNNVDYWPENSYYKVVFTCANTSETNGIVWLDNVSIYDYNAGDALAPSIELDGDNYTEVDDVVTLTATTANLTSSLVWSSSDNNIATVDQSGNVTAKSMGVATITAAADGAEAKFEFTVYPTDGSEITIAQALTICDWVGTAECAFTYAVTGVVDTINTEYNSQYNNITVTITDGANSIQAYRMTGGSDLVVGDKITVEGTLTKYSGNTAQFTKGATYVAVQDGDIVADAKEALTGVNAYMTMAYKYTVEEVAAPISYEVVASELGVENGVAVEELTNNIVTLTFDKGSNSNAPKYYTTGAAIRCYGGNTITFSSSVNITKIELTFASGEGTNEITADCGTYADGVWTGESTDVVLTIGGTTGHRRIATITVSYEGESNLTTNEYSDVEFRIRCGVDATLADIEGVQEYGIRVTAGDKTKDYAWNETDGIYGSADSKLFVTISLGDAINNDKLTTEFTVCAYVVIDGVTYISENTKTYSIASMVTEYYEVEGISEVADLYNRITSDLI